MNNQTHLKKCSCYYCQKLRNKKAYENMSNAQGK